MNRLRRIVGGIFIGFLQFYLIFVISTLLFITFQISIDDISPFASDTANFLVGLFIITLLAGLVGITCFNYKDTKKGFIVGAFIGVLTHSIEYVSERLLYGDSLYVPIEFSEFWLITPPLLGGLIAGYVVPKEDSSRKNHKLWWGFVSIVLITILIATMYLRDSQVEVSPVHTLDAVNLNEEIIHSAVAAKLQISLDGVNVVVDKPAANYNGKFAGGYYESGTRGERFIAARVGDKWEVAILGLGLMTQCKDVKKYNFPIDLLPECFNENDKLIERKN